MTFAEITQRASERFWRAVRRAAPEAGPVTVTFTSLGTTPVTAKPAHCKGLSAREGDGRLGQLALLGAP
jgi:hypothetical protein